MLNWPLGAPFIKLAPWLKPQVTPLGGINKNYQQGKFKAATIDLLQRYSQNEKRQQDFPSFEMLASANV